MHSKAISYSWFIAFLLMGLASPSIAQKPTISYVSPKDFPISEDDQKLIPFDIAVDSIGYVYLAGPAGVSRFNGTKLTPLNPNRGVYLSFYPDAKKRLWVKAYKQGLELVTADRLQPYIHSERLKEYWQKPWDNVYMDAQDTLHVGIRGHGYFTVSPNGDVSKKLGLEVGLHGFTIFRLKDGTLFHCSTLQDSAYEQEIGLSVYFQSADGHPVKVAQTQDQRAIHHSALIDHQDSSWTISMGSHTVISGRNATLTEQFQLPHEIVDLFQDSHEDLWIGTVGHGIQRLVGGKSTATEFHFNSTTAAVMAEDLSGGLWVKSEEQGFLRIPNRSMYRYTRENGQLPSNDMDKLTTDYKQLFFKLKRGQYFELENGSVRPIPDPKGFPIKPEDPRRSFPTVFGSDSTTGKLYVGNRWMLGLWDGIEWETSLLEDDRIQATKLLDLKPTKKHQFLGLTTHELLVIENGRVSDVFAFDQSIGNARCFAIAEDSLIWIGSDLGVWVWDGLRLSRPQIADYTSTFSNSMVYNIRAVKGKIWVQDIDHPLYVISDENIEVPTDEQDFPIQMFDYFVSDQSEIWGRCTERRNFIFRLGVEHDSIWVKSYTFDDLAFEFTGSNGQLAVIKDTLYLGNQGGLFRTPVSKLVEKEDDITLHIRDISANYNSIPGRAPFVLPHDQNSISMEFSAINYRLQEAQFRCRLLGFDSTWVVPKYNGLQYTNLDPGDYQFQIESQVRRQGWGPTKTVAFHIQTPYWQTWWFRILALAAGSGIIFGVAYLWQRAQRRRATLEIAKLKAEQQALRSQMDPHFVYNALNSAQKFLLLGNTTDYNTFIGQLTQLVRSGLEYSRLSFIPIEHELEFIENYLSIETQRFPDRFVYEIEVDEEVQENSFDIAIPPLMIQPICENAIKHAYDGTPVDLKLHIAFHTKQTLKVEISDNGVGYQHKKSANQRQKQKSSLGLDILSSRIAILQKQHLNASFLICPLHPESGRGTKVELLLPIR